MPCSRWLFETKREKVWMDCRVDIGVQIGVLHVSGADAFPHLSHRRVSIGPTSAGSARAAVSDRHRPTHGAAPAAAATIGGGDSGGKRWASMNCGSVVAPMAHTRPRPAPRPVTTTTMQNSRWLVDDDGRQVGLCVRDDRGRRGDKVGASAPWTAASGGGSHCRWACTGAQR